MQLLKLRVPSSRLGDQLVSLFNEPLLIARVLLHVLFQLSVGRSGNLELMLKVEYLAVQVRCVLSLL